MTSQASKHAVLCAGRLYCDLVFTGAPNLPTMGTETFAKGLSLHAGGGAFITAATLRAQGWDASLLSMFPAAPFDQIIRTDIQAFGVNAAHCGRADDSLAPQITVAIAGETDRAFLSHKSGSAIPKDSDAFKLARHLHIGELRTLVEHPDLIDKARQASMTISVDCGWDVELLGQGADVVELLKMVDIFLPNDAEFNHLIRSGMPEDTCPLMVIKCGGRGARALASSEWISQPAFKADIVDTTGAGDAFNGGFLASWLMKKSIAECLVNGNRTGQCSVEHVGGTGGLRNLQKHMEAAQ